MTIKISELGNLTVLTDNTMIPVVESISGILTTQRVSASILKTYMVGTASTEISGINSNIATLQSNAGIQSGQIALLVANAGAQSGSIGDLYANVAFKSGQIADLYANAALQSADITILYANAAEQSGQIVTANVGMKGYVDAVNSAWQANAATQAGQIEDLWANASSQSATIASISATIASGDLSSNVNIGGVLTVNSSNYRTAIANGGTNGVGNIGASGSSFNTVFAKATTAQYADLAENYIADSEYIPGTVVDFGGEKEITLSTRYMSSAVAGVVSTNPAYLMNDSAEGNYVIPVALQGRVPTRVVGNIVKGDLLVSTGTGTATTNPNPTVGSVIGKALENYNSSDEGIIEIVVGVR